MKTLRRLACALALSAPVAAAVIAAPPSPSASHANVFSPTVTPQGGYLRGKTDAPVKLVEFISYTCSHCATFDRESAGELQLGMIASGKGSVEVRPYIRNGIDLTLTLLAQCGPASRFPANHSAILFNQSKWMTRLEKATKAQQARWAVPDFGQRMRAVASDAGLYDLMATRGYSRIEVDRCLSDKAKAATVVAHTEAADKEYGLTGTPSFLINNTLQDVHSWQELRTILKELTR